MKILEPWFDIAFTQAIWLFVKTTPVMDLSKSCLEAKENATLVIMFLNVLRLVFDRFLDDLKKGPFSSKFGSKLAKITDDVEMRNFITESLQPLMEKGENLVSQVPRYEESEGMLGQLFSCWRESNSLHSRKQCRWISTISEVYKKLDAARKNEILRKTCKKFFLVVCHTFSRIINLNFGFGES